jgi:Ricin-type beta-trefoil lectin domain-like
MVWGQSSLFAGLSLPKPGLSGSPALKRFLGFQHYLSEVISVVLLAARLGWAPLSEEGCMLGAVFEFKKEIPAMKQAEPGPAVAGDRPATRRESSFKMRNSRLFALFFVVIAAGLITATARADDQIVQLVNVQSGKCLQPTQGSSANGVAIVQESCDGSAAQFWAMHFMASGFANNHTWYRLINQSTHLCLDARGGAVNGTPIQQWPCSGISNEKWGTTNCKSTPAPTTCSVASEIYNSAVAQDRPYTHCLATPGTMDGVSMVLMSCEGVPSQQWKLQGFISDAVKKPN